MRRAAWSLVTASLFAGCGGPSDTSEEAASRSDPILHGRLAEEQAVVALVTRRTSCDGPPPAVLCTGTLIAERLVLTAAHCVEGRARGTREVLFGPRLGAPDGVYRGIVAQVVHPLYDRQYDDHDIALLWLDAAAPVQPMALIDAAVDSSWVGLIARVVGFGGTLGAGTSPGERLEGEVHLTDVTTNTIRYEPSPGMTCRGDSGGPVIVDVAGKNVLAAITTSGDALCKTTGVGPRLDVHLADFIQPILAAGPPSSRAALTSEQVCEQSCSTDEDCPDDLVCRADQAGANRCLLPDVPVGAMRGSCRSDADCGDGSCVPFGAACRCDDPCASLGASGGQQGYPPPRDGCQIGLSTSRSSTTRSWSSQTPVWIGLFLWLASRRRNQSCLDRS